MSKFGVVARGIKLPMIKQGDDVSDIVVENIEEALAEANLKLKNKDIIAITESIVARANGNYVSVDDIRDDIVDKFGKNCEVILLYPIYSRNRFSLILKGIARASSKIHLFINNGKDEVGNDIVNPFTNVDIEKFYKELITSENCECVMYKNELEYINALTCTKNIIHCQCHVTDKIKKHYHIPNAKIYTLADICNVKTDKHGYNEEYGVLGSNKATEESLKLFPSYEKCKIVCDNVQKVFKDRYGVDIEVMVYGDGCFKDPVGGIWEFADPVTTPYYTSGLEGTPNEIKIKYLIDNELSEFDGVELNEVVKDKIKNKLNNLVGNMASQGTTPRRYIDLLASLSDLVTGSGDRATPVVWIQNYWNNYGND